MQKILVALDESPISLRAARAASALFPDAEFLVINVTRLVVPWVMAGEFGAVYPMRSADIAALTPDEAELEAIAHEAGIDDPVVLTPVGDPATSICEAAERHDVDVIVVGSHDKGVLRRLMDPSVAEAVVHGSHRPVLVVSGTPPER